MNGEDRVIRLLIAHTTNDKIVAENLRDYLYFNTTDQLECHLWEENKQNTIQDIRGRLNDIDLLLIIVASAIVDDEDWTWLARLTATSLTMSNGHSWRILLHNKALTPHLVFQQDIEHSFNSEVSRIKEFLIFLGSTVFTQDQRELNRNFTPQNPQLDRLAETISSWFEEPRNVIPEKKRILDQIALIVNDPDVLPISDSLTIEEALRLSREIGVKSETPRALEIFNLEDTPPGVTDNWSLEEIANRLPKDDSKRWLVELVESICSAHRARINPQPGKMIFRALDRRLFRPILHEKERCTDRSERFIVLFARSPNPGWVRAGDPYNTLLTALTLGSRLHWEVCTEYLPQLDIWQRNGTEAIREGLQQVKVSFEDIEEDANIRREGESAGQTNRVRLRDSFESEQEKNLIERNMSDQDDYKQILRNANTQDNVNEVRAALTELRRLNSIVMAMLATRYSQLLTQLRNEHSP